jgi:c-di-GMP-binding flagellar brake protein YcgR
MRLRRTVTPSDAAALFDRAVGERALAVLTLQSGSDWQTFKARFLERDPQGRFFVLDYQPGKPDETLPVVEAGQYIGVSFRQRGRKILFATVVEAKGKFSLDEQNAVPALRFRWPDSLTELQRRAYHRTLVPASMGLVASMWRGGVGARPAAQGTALEVQGGRLHDLSCGGALVELHQPAPPSWSDDDTLGVELELPDGRPAASLDARYRGTRMQEGGTFHAAIQFVGLEMTAEGRQLLHRLANSVQRLHRRSLSAGRKDIGENRSNFNQ